MHIYVINLKSRTDRRKNVIKEMVKHEITKYKFFDAIRPSLEDVNNWNKDYLGHINRLHVEDYDKYRIGCLGCLKSHVEVIKQALNNKYKYVLILEDDVVFKQDFHKIYEYIKQLKTFDMLYLSGSHLGKKERISDNIIKVEGTHTTNSYIINEKVMNYLVNNINGYKKEIDVFYAEEVQPIFNCYCIVPHMTKQSDGYSDIQCSNVSYKMAE